MKPAFSIQRGYVGREATAVIFEGPGLGLDFNVVDTPIEGTVPIGTVEFCSPLSGFAIDFFPECLNMYQSRYGFNFNTYGGFELIEDMFVKDLTGWKTEFETKLYHKGFYLPKGLWHTSKPVNMENEWRYYVVEGDCVTTGWYRGKDEEKLAPEIKFPREYTGAADFAEVDGELELVESHAPFACGWYGDNNIDYVYWQYFAWQTQFKG